MIISNATLLNLLSLFNGVTRVLASPAIQPLSHVSAIGNVPQHPLSLHSLNIINDKSDNFHHIALRSLNIYDEQEPPVRTSAQTRRQYRIQRECIKDVISDLNALNEVIRPQIHESEICGEMDEAMALAQQALPVALVPIPPANCLKFCADTQRSLKMNAEILAFADNHLDYEIRTLDNNQPTHIQAAIIRTVIDTKKQRIEDIYARTRLLDEECDSVLDKEANNIVGSFTRKKRFDRQCLPYFHGDIHYPTFPETPDIAYDGVSRHRADLIDTCRDMLIEHVELAKAEIWQKKSTGRGAVDFQGQPSGVN